MPVFGCFDEASQCGTRFHRFAETNALFALGNSHDRTYKGCILFYKAGLTRQRAEDLRLALLDVAQKGEVAEAIETPYGVKYVVDGELRTPTGESVRVRTVWVVEKGQVRPRFVTAYPRKGE